MKINIRTNKLNSAAQLLPRRAVSRVSYGVLIGRRQLPITAVAAGPINSSGGATSGGGDGSGRRGPNPDSGKVVGPQRPGEDAQEDAPWSSSSSSSGTRSASERPLFPPMGIPSDPAVSLAISEAETWQQLRDLYSAVARTIDPLQLLALTQRLAHVTGAVVWPEGAPLPEAAPPGGAPWAPVLTEREAAEVVALAQTLCRATQVLLPEVYGMQQVAGLLQALVSLGVAPPAGWLKSAEVVALRTQREGEGEGEGVRLVTSVLLNELLAIAAAFQRLGHVPDRSFVELLGRVRPLEELPQPRQGQGAEGEEQDGAPLLLVLSAPQLLCLARAVLLWGLKPPAEWPEEFLQATFTRISRANKLAASGPAGSGDEAMEAAEAEAALGVGGLGALLWAAVMVEARPADPGGRWMAELSAAALRRLRQVLAAPPVVVAAEAAGGAAAVTVTDGGASAFLEAAGASLQDMASLLSALQQVSYDPGPGWVSTCLQAAAAVQARTDPAAAVSAAAAAGSPPPGDALAGVLFLSAQYDHPQDDPTRGSVVDMAQAAQSWMQLQAETVAAAAAAAAAAEDAAAAADASSPVAVPAAPPPLFSARGLTQLLMALVRMGGQPSEEWMAAWGAAAEPLARGVGGRGFDLDQMVAVLATAAEAEVALPDPLQRAMVEGLLTPPDAAAAGSAAAGGISGSGLFRPGDAKGAPGSAGADAGASGAGGVRSLPQFRQLLGVLELQPHPLEPDWLEHFTALVEDFRLRLGPRELLAVLRVLGSFRETALVDTAGAAIPPASGPAGVRAAASTTARRPGAPIVLRPDLAAAAAARAGGLPPSLPSPFAASSSQSSAAVPGRAAAAAGSAPAILDSGWVGGLLEDLKVRGGLRGPDDLMQLAQALSSLSAPPSLLSYIEVFAVTLTGEDGRRRTSRTAAAAAPAAAAASGGAEGAPAAPALASASKPSAARIRLRLQKEAAERRGAAATTPAAGAAAAPEATGKTGPAGAAGGPAAQEDAAEAESNAEEAEQWALAWPAMLGAFAAAGHVPERRWWDRFAAATLTALETYEGPRLATTAVAALGLSSQAAAAAGPLEGPQVELDTAALAEKLLPSLAWHQQTLGHLAEAIRSCPVSLEEIREQAVEVLREQRREALGQAPLPASSSPSLDSDSDSDPDPSSMEAQGPAGAAATDPAPEEEFSAEEFDEVVVTLSSELPLLLQPLAQPRVALPPQLLSVLEDVAEEVVDAAEPVMEAAAAVVAGARPGRPAARGRGRAGAAGSAAGVADEGEDAGLVDLDVVAYAQQLVTLIMQVLIASEHVPGDAWMARMAEVMLVSRLEWGPGSETGELQQQEQLLLDADQLTTLSYLAGRCEMTMQPRQVRVVLQHAARLVTAGELDCGELAATLAGLSGLRGAEVAEEGPDEVAVMLESLASQSAQLSCQGLSEAATALLQLGLGLHPDLALRFRPATARCLPDLAPPQMLAVLTAGGSLGLEPPSRELLALLSQQVGRLAGDSDPLAAAAATEAAYMVLRWFPEVAPNDSDMYISRLRSGLKPLLGRLDEVAPASASKLALLLATAGVVPEEQGGSSGSSNGSSSTSSTSRSQAASAQRQAALAPLVDATAEGLPDYDNEQLSNAIMGLSLLQVQLPSSWLEGFMEASRRQLADADGRSLAYLLSGLADQGALPDPPFVAAFWSAVRRCASPPDRELDLLAARTLLDAAGQLGLRPDREVMQMVLDCALLRYRDAPDPEGLAELVQVMAAFSFVPSVGWAAEVRSVLMASISSMPPETRAAVLQFLQGVMPQPR